MGRSPIEGGQGSQQQGYHGPLKYFMIITRYRLDSLRKNICKIVLVSRIGHGKGT